jgi:hypothetical protein
MEGQHLKGVGMGVAPVDYLAVAFPGNKFSGAIIPEIKKLVDSGTIRVLDLVIITKDAEGNVAAIEGADAGPEMAAALAALGIEGQKLLGQDDFEDIGDALEPNSTCGLMIWENLWAADFAKSLRDADGVLLGMGRIPASALEELMAEGVA